jgi:hypothetical protein
MDKQVKSRLFQIKKGKQMNSKFFVIAISFPLFSGCVEVCNLPENTRFLVHYNKLSGNCNDVDDKVVNNFDEYYYNFLNNVKCSYVNTEIDSKCSVNLNMKCVDYNNLIHKKVDNSTLTYFNSYEVETKTSWDENGNGKGVEKHKQDICQSDYEVTFTKF